MVKTTQGSYDRILLLETNELSVSKINEITKTIVIKIENLVIGETVFTGGINQNQAIIAHINSPNNREFFLIPLQHKTTATVVS